MKKHKKHYVPLLANRRLPPAKGYTGHGEWWSEEMMEDLLSLHSQGYGYKTLANHFDRTRDAVRSKLRELRGDGRETRARGPIQYTSREAWQQAVATIEERRK